MSGNEIQNNTQDNAQKNYSHQGDYEGRQEHIPSLTLPSIEVFANVYNNNDYLVSLQIPEFTAICPKTSLPDFGTIYLDYKPSQVCLELKSLKEYFLTYRNLGIFHENVVNKVCDDLVQACSPRYLKVRAVYNSRGGIVTSVEREYGKM